MRAAGAPDRGREEVHAVDVGKRGLEKEGNLIHRSLLRFSNKFGNNGGGPRGVTRKGRGVCCELGMQCNNPVCRTRRSAIKARRQLTRRTVPASSAATISTRSSIVFRIVLVPSVVTNQKGERPE